MFTESITWETVYYCNFCFILDVLPDGHTKITGYMIRKGNVFLISPKERNYTKIVKDLRTARGYCVHIARKGVDRWFTITE